MGTYVIQAKQGAFDPEAPPRGYRGIAPGKEDVALAHEL